MTIVMFTNGIMTIVIKRVKRPIRRAFIRGLKDSLALLANLGSDGVAARRDADAIVALSCLVGALILARAVDEEAFSRRILGTVAKRLKGRAKRAAA
jgi:TetR/AcrR family transcriptional repressor of nem operon